MTNKRIRAFRKGLKEHFKGNPPDFDFSPLTHDLDKAPKLLVDVKKEKYCQHTTLHTEIVRYAEPLMVNFKEYIETYCADCGERIKRVQLKANK